MECFHHRVSYATWRLHAFRPLLAPDLECHSSRNTRPPCRRISVSPPRHNQAHKEPEKNSTVDSSTSDVPPSQKLPQSPLLTHPRHGVEKQRKPRPTAEDTNRLRKNPWAVALASPPRMCSVTGVRVPRAFLGEWGLVRRPDSEQLYILPVGLFQDSLRRSERPDPNQHSPSALAEPNEKQSLSPDAAGQANKLEDGAGPQPIQKAPRTVRKLFLRIIDHLPLLQTLSIPFARRSSVKKHPALKLLPFRWKHPWGPMTAREEKRITWMKDAPDFVLRRMRSELAQKLDTACRRYKRLRAANGVWNVLDLQDYSDAALAEALGGLDAFERMECGAVLLLGLEKADANAEHETSHSSPDYVTLPQTQSKVPVFDLSRLLQDADLQKVRDSHPHFQHAALFFRPDEPATIEAMLSLWRMKRFLAGYALPQP